MTLADLTLPMGWGECKDLALVYPYTVAVLLYADQQTHGDPRHVAAGRELTDGRWMLCGDVLSEVGPGGILAWITAQPPEGEEPVITPEVLAQIEVVPLGEVVALLPPEQEVV